MKYRSLAACTFALALVQCASSLEAIEGKPPHHLQGGGFRNPEGSWQRGASFTVRWGALMDIGRTARATKPSDVPDSFKLDPAVARANLQAHQANGARDTVSWVGQATFLIRLGGVHILTDPIFSERASPVGFAGPKRLHAPRITIADLPPVDIIVISHAHYDHLDMPSLRRIAGKERVRAFVPLGLGRYLREAGYTHVTEMDWYDEHAYKGVRVIAYPAVHWSSRTPFDENETLWISFGLGDGTTSIYHSGDSEWHDTLFSEIGVHMERRLGSCALALLSAGAYEPRSLMRGTHATPEDAVRMGKTIGCARLTPMHWGTYVLSTEPIMEPEQRFRKAAGAQEMIMKFGETRLLPQR